MGWIKQVRRRAQDVAKEGLLRLGVRVPATFEEDNPDVEDRDILDILHDVSRRWEARRIVSIPESLRAGFENQARQYCGDNDALLQVIKTWIGDRASAFAEARQEDSASRYEDEFWRLLTDGGVVATVDPEESAHESLTDTDDDIDTGSRWFETVQAISRAQNRCHYNLLFQADRQCVHDNFEVWRLDMNDRLAPFELSIVGLPGNRVSLLGTDDVECGEPCGELCGDKGEACDEP